MRTNNTKTYRHLITTAAALLVGCVLANAQTPAPEPEKPKWDGAVNAGLTLASGNSDTLLATVGVQAKKKWDQNEFMLGAAGGYGTSDSTRNTDFAEAFAQYNRLFTERFYGGLRISANYDGIAQLSYRVNITPLVGYFFIKNDRTTLSADVGPSLVIEKFFNQSQDIYCGLRFGQRFDHKLTDTTRIWESASYTPQVDRWAERYVINVELGISAAINKAWGLRVVAQYIYNSEPATGLQPDDFRLIAGTEYKF